MLDGESNGIKSTCMLLLDILGTDEKALIQVLTCRSNQQRQEIKNRFKTMYGKVRDKEQVQDHVWQGER